MVEFVRVGSLADFPVAAAVAVDAAGTAAVVVNTGAGLFACGRHCTHANADLAGALISSSGEIVCPLHVAVFDPRTGACIEGPAGAPLPVYAVRVAGDDVCLGVG